MKVAEVAAKTGVSLYAIRYYLRIGLLTPARQPGNRYRQFSDRDMKRLLFLRKAQGLGFTLKEIRKIFKLSESGLTPCPLVRELVQFHVVGNARRLEELVELQHRMESALRRWKKMPDRAPDGNAICHLIEST